MTEGTKGVRNRPGTPGPPSSSGILMVVLKAELGDLKETRGRESLQGFVNTDNSVTSLSLRFAELNTKTEMWTCG